MAKGYGTKVVKHPQGFYYKVRFLTPRRTLKKSKLLSAWWPNGRKIKV